MLTLDDGRKELWQWDTGRKISVDKECSQVHFSNKVFGRSVDVNVVDGIAKIPDVLLQTDKDLMVWAFVGTPENGYTKISKVFKVNRRNKPADYVFTPTDQTSIKELNNRIEKLEANQSEFAKQTDVDKLYEEIANLIISGGGISSNAKNLLITILRNAVYSSDQSENITELEIALASGDSSDEETEQPESGIVQTGSVLAITSGVTATQTGTVLAIA